MLIVHKQHSWVFKHKIVEYLLYVPWFLCEIERNTALKIAIIKYEGGRHLDFNTSTYLVKIFFSKNKETMKNIGNQI